MKQIFTLAWITLATILCSNILNSQEIVVSEYNTQNPEWIEFIVVEDNIDLEGYSFRDNGSSMDRWSDRVYFTDDPLWKNLREGTIIVIWNRKVQSSGRTDILKSDGYIEVGVQRANGSLNSQFFNIVDFSSFLSRFQLDFNANNDVVQILDPLGNNVHALGYMTSAYASTRDFSNINGPKLARSSTEDSYGIIKVVPGRNINDYQGGYDANYLKTDENLDNGTKGLPNYSQQYQHINQLYWRELREPDYAPVANFTIEHYTTDPDPNNRGVLLKWEPSAPSQFLNNDYEGYIIVKAEAGDFGGFHPVDGTIYNTNQDVNAGNAQIVTYVKGLYQDEYLDPYGEFECGKEYGYRIYMYRYNSTDVYNDLDGDPRNARGRSYSEKFAKSDKLIGRTSDPDPRLTIISPEEATFCAGEQLIIESNIENENGIERFDWLTNRGQLSDYDVVEQSIKRLVINNFTGDNAFRLQIFNEYECSSNSEYFEVNAVATPESALLLSQEYDSEVITSDTTISICPDEEYDLEAYFYNINLLTKDSLQYEWFKDGQPMGIVAPGFRITEKGEYFAVINHKNMCPDTTITVTVDIKDIEFDINPKSLTFNVPPAPVPQTITITNNSDRDITFDKDNVIVNGLFYLSTLPVTIAAGESENLTVIVTINKVGEYDGEIIFTDECDNTKEVTLKAIIEDNDETFLTADKYVIDFGYILKCDGIVDSTFNLIANGNKQIQILKPDFSDNNSKFILGSPDIYTYPISGDGSSLPIRIEFGSSQVGEYVDTLTYNYNVDGELSENPIKIVLRANVVNPELEIIDDTFDFSIIYCEDHIDTVMRVFNKGPHFNITIDQSIGGENNNLYNILEFTGNTPLTIQPGDTVKVPVRLFANLNPPIYNFIYGPCASNSTPITINGNNDGEEPTLSQNSIDFGVFNLCEDNGDSTITLSIDTKVDGLYIDRINGFDTGSFESDLTEGRQLLIGNNEFTITLPLPNPNGLANPTDIVDIYIEPCGILLKISMTARFYEPIEPSISTNSIDYGTYLVGDPIETRTFDITNNDNEPLILEQISNSDPNFILQRPNIADLPIVLAPNQTLEIEYSFEPNDEGFYNDIVEIIYDNACDFDTNISLSGEATVIIPPGKILVSLPNNLESQPGYRIDVPVIWKAENGFNMISSDVERIEIYLNYDGAVFYPFDADPSEDVTNITENVEFEEYDAGKAKLVYDIIDSDAFDPIYLGIFKGRALLGSKLNTELNIDSINVVSSTTEVTVETESGLLTVNGICEIETRLLEVNGTFDLNVDRIEQDAIELNISVVTQDNTNLRIYDQLGNPVVELLNGSLIPGQYTLNYNNSEMSSGVYYVVMKSGNFTKTQRFIILK